MLSPGAEVHHVLRAHVLRGCGRSVVPGTFSQFINYFLLLLPVLQQEHCGAVLLRPLEPLAVLQPAPARLRLATDHDEDRPALYIELQVLRVPGQVQIKIIGDLKIRG